MAANRIIIVEDDPAIAETVALNLRYVGYEYMLFDDGQKAADYLISDHSFDLALLDIMLPGIDLNCFPIWKNIISRSFI